MNNINTPYRMYMMEQEGFLNTRESKIQKIIKEVKQVFSISEISVMDANTFNTIVEKNGINPISLTDTEKRQIQNAIW